MEHLINIEMKHELQSHYIIESNYQRMTELVTDMFYPYFFILGNSEQPEKIRPITLKIDFNPLEGTIVFLESEIEELQQSLASGHIPQGFQYIFETLQNDLLEHYRLTTIKNKSFNQEDFENFKLILKQITKKQILSIFFYSNRPPYPSTVNDHVHISRTC